MQVFHLVSFEAMYKLKIPKLVNNIIFPKTNVATLEKNACVIEGVRYVLTFQDVQQYPEYVYFFLSRSRNNLLNGDTKHYDWDSGYTCHQLGSGAILIQLGQYLSTCCLLFITG